MFEKHSLIQGHLIETTMLALPFYSKIYDFEIFFSQFKRSFIVNNMTPYTCHGRFRLHMRFLKFCIKLFSQFPSKLQVELIEMKEELEFKRCFISVNLIKFFKYFFLKEGVNFINFYIKVLLHAYQIGTFNIEILYMPIVHRVL